MPGHVRGLCWSLGHSKFGVIESHYKMPRNRTIWFSKGNCSHLENDQRGAQRCEWWRPRAGDLQEPLTGFFQPYQKPSLLPSSTAFPHFRVSFGLALSWISQSKSKFASHFKYHIGRRSYYSRTRGSDDNVSSCQPVLCEST